jgi:hypothetical protein
VSFRGGPYAARKEVHVHSPLLPYQTNLYHPPGISQQFFFQLHGGLKPNILFFGPYSVESQALNRANQLLSICY